MSARCLFEVSISDAALALRRYENARQGRTAQVQTSSLMNRDLFHMLDGQEQEDWDMSFSLTPSGMSLLDWVFEYDAITVAIQSTSEIQQLVIARAISGLRIE